MTWNPLSPVAKNRIADARLQLHWAIQIPASVGYSFVEPEEDWSHVSLVSHSHIAEGGDLLVSRPAKMYGGFSVGLRLMDLTLVLLNNRQEIRQTYALSGRTLEDGYTWLETVVQPYLPADLRPKIIRPDHELPAHPVSEGALFSAEDQEALLLLSNWYVNAASTLQNVTDNNLKASLVRCWPHHFDIATLLVFDTDKDAEEARSVGVGFVPGDSSYNEPYIYVTSWPYPENPSLPELERGHWHQDGWFGAVFNSTELIEAGEAQHQYVLNFLASAIAANKAFLAID